MKIYYLNFKNLNCNYTHIEYFNKNIVITQNEKAKY